MASDSRSTSRPSSHPDSSPPVELTHTRLPSTRSHRSNDVDADRHSRAITVGKVDFTKTPQHDDPLSDPRGGRRPDGLVCRRCLKRAR